jgi:preprotein translocase subunit SecB
MRESKRRSSPPPDSDYLEFIKAVHLNAIALDSATLSIDREALASHFQGPDTPRAEVSARKQVFDVAPESFSIRGDYKVEIKAPGGQEIVKIECTYSASFSLERAAEEAQIERFAGEEVQLIFFPYLRQFISDITARMAIPPLVLPLTSELKARPSSPGRKGAKRPNP